MTDKEQKTLIALLKKIKMDNLVPPNLPFDIWRAIQDIVPTPVTEVLVTRTWKDFLLVDRHDKFWDGWHIPGGFMSHKESVEGACQRFAQKELGISVNFQKVISAYAWPDHPYGNPVSIVCVCKPLGEPKSGKFFTKIPDNMIPHHRDFLKEFLAAT